MVQHWAHEEFRDVPIKDKRLRSRLIDVVKSLADLPESSINQACNCWAAAKGAYRFFDNPNVRPIAISTRHRAMTKERAQKFPYVLAIQDSSALNYHHHPSKAEEIGVNMSYETDHGRKVSRGLMTHTTLCLSPAGVPLGILDFQVWRRGIDYQEEKESTRWIKALGRYQPTEKLTNFVTVADREADFNEFILEIQGRKGNFVIRAKSNRIKRRDDESGLNFLIASAPFVGEYKERVRNKKMKTSRQPKESNCERFQGQDKKWDREATLMLQARSVELTTASKIKFKVNVVRVSEASRVCEDDEDLIEWVLFTSLSIETLDDIKKVISIYKQRWRIEEYFKVLKSGLGVEDCRLETYARLCRYLNVASIVAWRIMWSNYYARVNPEAPCTEFLSDGEWRALFHKMNNGNAPINGPPTVRQAILWIARLGGHLGRKGDGYPGNVTLWRGWRRMID